MFQCDEGREVKTDDSHDEKCLTLEDVSAARVSKATDSPVLKDLLLLRKECLPAFRDDAENNGEENASLEANYGDESSCCVSDVSSLSFQNAVLDDPEYNSSSSALVAGEHNSVGSDQGGNDLEAAEELENPGELHEIIDEIVEMSEDLGEINEAKLRQFAGSNGSRDNSQIQRSRNERKDCDGNTDVDGSMKFSSPREVGMQLYQVGDKSRCEEDGLRNADHVVGRKGQQHLKNSPGLARRMLADDGVEVGSVGGNVTSVESLGRDCSGADGEKKGIRKQEKELLKKDASRTEKDVRGQNSAVKDLENGREKRSRDQEKRDRIAHMDAVYQKQIEALMLTQSSDGGHGSPPELQTTSADVRNEYSYIRCTRVPGNKLYFGMDMVQSSSELDRGAASVKLDSVSECSEAKKPDVVDALKKATQPDFTELSSDAAEYDPEESSAANGGKAVACHMPSVEDGLSSGHTSDCDEVATSRRDPSPAQALQLRQKMEVQRRPTSLVTSGWSAVKENADATTNAVSGMRQRDVELAIQDIRSAIARSKRVKMISPSAAGEEPVKQIDKRSEEPVWITRKEQARDLQRQPSKNQEEESSSSSPPPDLANCQKNAKSHSIVKGQVSVTRKHNKQYVALPLADNDTDQDNDSESLADSQSRTRKTQSRAADSGAASNHSQNAAAADRCVGSVGLESAGRKHSDPSGPRAEMGPQVGGSEQPEESTRASRADEQPKAKHRSTPRHGRSSEEYSAKTQSEAVEGDFSTDEETDELLNKQYTQSEKVDIPELTTSPLSQNQNERRQNRAREVALRDPANETVLIEGVLFRANYLGSTQLISEGQPSKGMRMMQAQEAVGRIKAPDGENQPSTEVDLFVSVEKVMVLNTDLQEIMMDHALRTISYIADIGDILVIMARRGPIMNSASDGSTRRRSQTKICCHVFESDEAQLIAQSIGQAFQVSYMEFLKANGIDNPSHIRELDYQEVLNQQEIFGEELYLFSNREMQKEIIVPKVKGEPLGVVVVESGWGSMVPTVVLANMSPNGAAARCGQLNIGDQIMSINGISLVGLPLSTCQNYIKVGRHQSVVKVVVVSCPPVVEVLIKRPDIKYQLGFSVQNGVICSLLRGGIAERGGIRVGHRIIEINGQSVVAVSHDKIVQMLATSVGEIQMRTMPTSIFRLLTGQDVPHYI